MKIAVLSECFLSETHIAYLRSLGTLDMYPETPDEESAISRMAEADIVLADMYETPLNARVLEKSGQVKLLCINSTGFDFVALDAAAKANVKVANTPGFSTEAVAEHTFALLLALNRHIIDASSDVRRQPFQINPANKEHYRYLGFTLFGKTIGIIGLGAIGSHVARIANGFGMRVIAFNRSPKMVSDVELVSLDTLCARSDVISVHTSFNAQSEGLINAASIALMKPDAVVINTARGKCVTSIDLAAALSAQKIAGAALDDVDHWALDNPLFASPHTLITPHLAWFTQGALDKIGDIMTKNVRAFIEGKPQNIVSS